MLSRSTALAFKANATSQVRTVAIRQAFVRLNSTESSEQAKATKKQFKKPFFDTYVDYLKSQKLNEQGEFLIERPTQKDYDNSELAKYVKSAITEKDRLIEEKLKVLAEENGLKYEDLKTQFDAKVNEKVELVKSKHAETLSKIENFVNRLALPVNGPSNLVSELLDGLLPFAESLNEAAAFKYIYEIDPDFAKAFGKIIRLEPTQETVNEMAEAFKSGPISKITDSQYEELKKLLAHKKTTTSAEPVEDTTEEVPENISHPPVDGLTILENIFSNLNTYENINSSPLMQTVQKIDPEFAALLKSYEGIDSNNDDLLKAKYQEILDYCSNQETKIYKSFGDSGSAEFALMDEALKQPIPIDLTEIYEVFEFYPDYFASNLFKSIEAIDPKFGKLLNELETLPEGKELEEKNDEIDAYLANKETPIYVAMNDTQSSSFSDLRSILDAEWEKMESTVTADKLVEYVVQNGLESDGFKLISKIDPEFASLTQDLCTEKDNEKAMATYAKIQEYLQEPNAIVGALEDKESLNYQLLADHVFLKPEKEAEVLSVTDTPSDDIAQIEPISDKTDSVFENLKKEDQSRLPEDVAKMNEMYDMAIDIIDEIEQELTSNTFIPVSRQVSAKLDKLLGFQPSTEQVVTSEELKGKSLPKQKDEVLELAVNIIMKDGKKEIARGNLNRALYLLFLETRSNPVEKLKEALDVVAPIVVTKTVKTGFAKNFTVPVPLTQRQRNRMALLWILNSSDSKASNDFAVRLCDEILHVLSGKSSLMDKRVLSHKMAIANRSYLSI
ncbi:hypothetical protein PMKS-000752 [Pichia membranifaciens]|uniref:Small ribosomal subunit protein uS7 domain-containing protein n=1 Tax=Pichia membranifaciens TaxID=4926 RepID=A0A1Q2YCR3_9ASCO|nr:hypothetical protein PMKS-000752 [Pichia membranifaciens]